MSTFIVNLAGIRNGAFRGKVRHVRTGEEAPFSSAADLLGFLERMNAACHDDSEQRLVGASNPDPPAIGGAPSREPIVPRRRPLGDRLE